MAIDPVGTDLRWPIVQERETVPAQTIVLVGTGPEFRIVLERATVRAATIVPVGTDLEFRTVLERETVPAQTTVLAGTGPGFRIVQERATDRAAAVDREETGPGFPIVQERATDRAVAVDREETGPGFQIVQEREDVHRWEISAGSSVSTGRSGPTATLEIDQAATGQAAAVDLEPATDLTFGTAGPATPSSAIDHDGSTLTTASISTYTTVGTTHSFVRAGPGGGTGASSEVFTGTVGAIVFAIAGGVTTSTITGSLATGGGAIASPLAVGTSIFGHTIIPGATGGPGPPGEG